MLRLAQPLQTRLVQPLTEAPAASVAGPTSVLSAILGPTADELATDSLEGWAATWRAGNQPTLTPDSAPELIGLVRQGFTTAGVADTAIAENLIATFGVHQPYPNQASLTTNTVSLSDYIYPTDTVSGGCANNSTLASPKPVAQWLMLHRLMIGNTLTLECFAAHRNARNGAEVACVVYRVSDGVHADVTATVSALTVSTRTTDRAAVLCYAASLDVSSLNDGVLTVNAKVYPWIGDAASVLDSAAQSARREFSPRYFYKNTARFAAPPVAVVDLTLGVDATGVWTTTPLAGGTLPFATMKGATDAYADVTRGTPATGGRIDGCEIWFRTGTHTSFAGSASTRLQDAGALTLTRHVSDARAGVILSFSGFRPRLGGSLDAPLTTGAMRFHDITLVRTSTGTFQGEAAEQLEILWDDVDIDVGGAAGSATWLNQSHDYMNGVSFTNMTAGSGATMSAATYEHRLQRGLLGSNNHLMEGWAVFGCAISSMIGLSTGTRTESGGMVCFNKWWLAGQVVSIAASSDCNGYAIVGNLFEWTSVTNGIAIRMAADSATGNATHIILHNNTVLGSFINGRNNAFYDEGPTPRKCKLLSDRGNIYVQINTKGDVFRGTVQAGADAATRQGNRAYKYGVGCADNIIAFRDAGSGGLGTSFAPWYAGLNAQQGTSDTVRIEPTSKYDNYQAYDGGAAGAGNGDYRTSSSSIAKGKTPVARKMLPYDLNGVARASPDDVGCYCSH